MGNDLIYFDVSRLDWNRVFLDMYIDSNYTGTVDFELELFTFKKNNGYKSIDAIDVKKKIKIKSEKISDDKFKFTFNLAAIDGRSFLDNGIWRVVAIVGDKRFTCNVKNELAYSFDDLSRIFKYSGGKYAYNISFNTFNDNDKNLVFLIESYFRKENKKWNKRNYIEEAETISGKFRDFYKTIVVSLIKVFYCFWEKLSFKRGKNILFMSETKDFLWGNLLYIDRRLKERQLDKEYNISYSFRKAVGHKNSILSWVKLVFLLSRQDYIFVDDYVPILGFLNLSKRTKLIQVWHAGVGFKSVGYSRFGKEGSPHPTESCHKKYDYALVGSEQLKHVYAEVFGIEEEAFLSVGMPRLDGFLDEEKISSFRDEFYETYPLLKNKKIIMFAPTFRGAGQKIAYYNYDWLDLDALAELCGDEYVFLIKMHPFIQEKIEIPEKYKDVIIEFSSFKNINDLYYVTDLLITDYSSNYYEYALMRKPVVFYTPDRELYEISRGVHRSIKDSAPGKVCDTFEDLINSIKNEDYEFDKTIEFIEENFSGYAGNASDKVIDLVLLQDNNRTEII